MNYYLYGIIWLRVYFFTYITPFELQVKPCYTDWETEGQRNEVMCTRWHCYELNWTHTQSSVFEPWLFSLYIELHLVIIWLLQRYRHQCLEHFRDPVKIRVEPAVTRCNYEIFIKSHVFAFIFYILHHPLS